MLGKRSLMLMLRDPESMMAKWLALPCLVGSPTSVTAQLFESPFLGRSTCPGREARLLSAGKTVGIPNKELGYLQGTAIKMVAISDKNQQSKH